MRDKVRRPMAKVNRDRQIGLFAQTRPGVSAPVERALSQPCFIDPDPNEIYIGSRSLSSHLKAMGVCDAFVVREVLREADYGSFEGKYSSEGRRAYAPASMAGIVLYGLMRGVSSLRELERFARVDLGCMWVSGGNTPDHSVLGRFIGRHSDELSELLFSDVVAAVLKRTGSSTETLAGDGTVIEAMSSRYGVLTAEAAKARLSALEAKGEALSEAEQTERRALEKMTSTLDARRTRNGGRGHDRLNPAEADAAVLKQKGGHQVYRSSYVPVVLANDARVVVDAEVDSSQERAPMEQLIDRQERPTEELMLDAGFRSASLLAAAVEREMNVLMPAEGGGSGQTRRKAPKYFPLSRFRYDEAADVYHCPAGQVLKPTNRYRQEQRVRYSSKACLDCALRDQCTRGKRRTIERTAATELREALAQVMAQPQAQARYAKRQAWVEPVFSMLRGRQGLNRFRRRGLAKVRVEFRLHVMAYNLSRVVAWVSSAFWRRLGPLKLFASDFSRRWSSKVDHPSLGGRLTRPAQIAA